ncbi:GntR family transcriptional regulator [Phyllobacterium sp. SB3]|uniref:GntR family transcriptional regulator n=1 Tax=Phyllobacterium sp. SB3 TaxID=3156073 RepID=UPI0032AF38AC
MNKIEYRTLNDRAYDSIKHSLMAAEFAAGQPLIIRTLAETYGISTTPVREALQRLVAERLLDLLPNRTIAVPELDAEKFTEILRIRCALEGIAAGLATEHVKKTHIRRLRKLMQDMDTALGREDYNTYRSTNQEFHFTLYDQARSPRLLQIIQDMWGQAGPYMKELFSDGRYKPIANNQHSAIIEALEQSDTVLVTKHVVVDITDAGNIILERLANIKAR